MAVMAVWRRRWKRHILVAVVNAVPMSLWSSTNLLDILHGRFSETSTKLCKMPGGTWINFCWLCAAGLSERLAHYSLFCGQS